jgi:hypothetical protein
MKTLAALSLMVLSLSAPARLYGQQNPGQQHEQHHGDVKPAPASAQSAQPPAQPQNQPASMMARMKASSAQLDVLVKKMNAATGTARIDAMAELLTALVEDRREHESMMGGMAEKMSKMHGANQNQGQAPAVK